MFFRPGFDDFGVVVVTIVVVAVVVVVVVVAAAGGLTITLTAGLATTN
jgi:hypothetical protein